MDGGSIPPTSNSLIPTGRLLHGTYSSRWLVFLRGLVNARVINVICFLILIGFSIWSIITWKDGNEALATYLLVWAIVLPAAIRSFPP